MARTGVTGAYLAAAKNGERVLSTRGLKLCRHASLLSMCPGHG